MDMKVSRPVIPSEARNLLFLFSTAVTSLGSILSHPTALSFRGDVATRNLVCEKKTRSRFLSRGCGIGMRGGETFILIGGAQGPSRLALILKRIKLGLDAAGILMQSDGSRA